MMHKVSFLVILLGFLEVQGGSIKATKIATVHAIPSESNGFKLRVSTGGEDYHLNLKKPGNSIFSPGFKFLETRVNGDGVTEIHDKTPTPEELLKAEQHLYLTSGSASGPQALVNIHKDEESGNYRVNGYIDGHKINHHSEDKHILTPTEPINREISAPSLGADDYIDLGRNITASNALMTRTAITAQPEILVLFDYANYQTFNGDTNSINDYISVFYHAINNRFDTLTDPKITATVTGVFSFNSRAAQPFLEESKIPDGSAYDMGLVLEKLSYWVYQNNATLPKYDVAALLSAEEFKKTDSSGNYVPGPAGKAYLGGACLTNSNTKRYFGASVNVDKGGFWDGVLTATHELAHNLNAPHDGDSGASPCPWSNGYIMSYEGWGNKTKFYFSTCSKSLMKTFISSTQGACVKSYQATGQFTLFSDSPGDRLNMSAQCQKYLNRTDAVAETATQDMCTNLKCRVPNGTNNGYLIWTMNRMAMDNSPCGTNMICKNWECIAKPT